MPNQIKHEPPIAEAVLTFLLEGLAAGDLITDLMLMKAMVLGRHVAWFSLSLFMMLCPFLMGYGSLVSLKIAEIKEDEAIRRKQDNKQSSWSRRLETALKFTYMSPIIMGYLFFIDVLYMVMTITVLPPLLLLIFLGQCKRDNINFFDDSIEYLMS
jgi:hypothetical protein